MAGFSDAALNDAFGNLSDPLPIESKAEENKENLKATVMLRAKEKTVTLSIHGIPATMRDNLNLLARALGISVASLTRNTFDQILKTHENVIADFKAKHDFDKGSKNKAKK